MLADGIQASVRLIGGHSSHTALAVVGIPHTVPIAVGQLFQIEVPVVGVLVARQSMTTRLDGGPQAVAIVGVGRISLGFEKLAPSPPRLGR